MNENVKKVVWGAMFAALICVTTMFPQIPTGFGGYVHLGDGAVLCAAAFLGPFAAMPAALGSALADIASGYVLYAPATFIIKGCVAFVAAKLYTHGRDHALGRNLFAYGAGEALMIAGYFAFEAFALEPRIAFVGIIPNLVQAVFAITLATVAMRALSPRFER